MIMKLIVFYTTCPFTILCRRRLPAGLVNCKIKCPFFGVGSPSGIDHDFTTVVEENGSQLEGFGKSGWGGRIHDFGCKI